MKAVLDNTAGPCVYMTRGLNSGNSLGQAATFVVTLDERLTGAFLTNPTAAEHLGTATTRTGQGDPRFEQMRAVFATYPTPCWAFG